jgi:hypothetical protein
MGHQLTDKELAVAIPMLVLKSSTMDTVVVRKTHR